MKITKRELQQMIYETVQDVLSNRTSIKESFTFGDAKRILIPLGWNVTYNGLNAKIDKSVEGKTYTTSGHLKHDGRTPERRSLDVEQMDELQKWLVDDFLSNGDMNSFEAIKQIPWEQCGTGHGKIKSPFKNVLKDYDPETGKKKEKEVVLTRGQKGAQTRLRKQIENANKEYAEAILEPIDYDNPEGAQLMGVFNDAYRRYYYNTCRSPQDRRPLLKFWTSDKAKRKGRLCLGKDDMKRMVTNFYAVMPDGSLDTSHSIDEQMKVSNVSNLSESQFCKFRMTKKSRLI